MEGVVDRETVEGWGGGLAERVVGWEEAEAVAVRDWGAETEGVVRGTRGMAEAETGEAEVGGAWVQSAVVATAMEGSWDGERPEEVVEAAVGGVAEEQPVAVEEREAETGAAVAGAAGERPEGVVREEAMEEEATG